MYLPKKCYIPQMKSIDSANYKVQSPIKLSETPTFDDLGADEDELKDSLKKIRRKLGKFQDTLYATANTVYWSVYREWIPLEKTV